MKITNKSRGKNVKKKTVLQRVIQLVFEIGLAPDRYFQTGFERLKKKFTARVDQFSTFQNVNRATFKP